MRVLVTGATGFVGSNLAAALTAQRCDVRVLRRESSRLDTLEGIPVEHAIGDILDEESLVAAINGCERVFHVAAMSEYWRSTKESVYRVNVDGTRNVVAAALRAGVTRFVHTSSVAAIGIPRGGGLADETQEYPPEMEWWAYGHSKYLAEREVIEAVERGLDAVIVNPAIVLGPRDVNFISGSLIRASVKGQLRVVPPGGSNVVHVDAVVAGHLAAADKGRTGERYILGGENVSHWDMAEIIASVTGGARPRVVLPRWLLPPVAWIVDGFNALSRRPPLTTGEQIRLGGEAIYVDVGKAVRELDLPRIPLRKAAEDAYLWYRDNGLL